MEEMKKLLLSTIGAAAISIEKADALLQELIEKGKLSVKEGKELREELLRKKKENDSKPVKKDELLEILDTMNYAGKRELEALEERVKKLEERLDAMTKE
jgi:polyhydroxyalkanoate synthesis regulator phasin